MLGEGQGGGRGQGEVRAMGDAPRALAVRLIEAVRANRGSAPTVLELQRERRCEGRRGV